MQKSFNYARLLLLIIKENRGQYFQNRKVLKKLNYGLKKSLISENSEFFFQILIEFISQNTSLKTFLLTEHQ